jgi:hypothetical protein
MHERAAQALSFSKRPDLGSMAGTPQADPMFVYVIPIPPAVRVLALAVSVALFTILFGIPLIDLGPARMVETFRSDTATWAIFGGLVGSLIAFFIVLAFPPRSWHAGLQFENGYVRLNPRPVLRWIDEPSVEMFFGFRVQEILLCRGSRDDSSFGFRVILRAVGAPDQQIKVETGDNLNHRQSKLLADGITAATGLAVRLVEFKAGKGGMVREMPWTPASHSMQWLELGKVAAAVLPVAGGILIGNLRPSPAAVILTGIALWLVEVLGVFLYHRFSHQERTVSASNWFSSLVNFAFAYTIAFAFVIYVFGKH